MPARRARLVSLRPTPAALACTQGGQGRGLAVRGREVHLYRAVTEARATTFRAAAGATAPQQGRGDGQTLHGRRTCARKSSSPRQIRLCRGAPLALGRPGAVGSWNPANEVGSRICEPGVTVVLPRGLV